ncbi:putative membrane-bound dehydrogenase domain protein [Verrucomicrobiia bacterium DG1235]|nr:putative membrane-bound dehydrogenase domain protein [Verrucomicrobiae bacterium DG1235]
MPDDLEVTVWARSPDLRNPTNMDIDHAGRIWVAEGVNYRWSKGRDPKGDRIAVLEDTNGDGKADKSWTFVQEPELVAPLGVAVIDNKIYVSNAPDLIVYTDVDRDLVFDPRVDKREVLLTGFNGINHDHALHSVTFGPDGLLYLNHGNSGALVTDRSGETFRVGSSYDGLMSGDSVPLYGILPKEYAGAKSDDGHVYVGGFAMRIQEDGTKLQVIGYNFRNSYEQTVNSFGDVFQNDNDDPPASRTTYLLEYGSAGWFSPDGSRYWQADRRPGQDIPTAQWRQDDPGVMPAGDVYGAGAPTGIVYYEGDALGKKWRGTLLSCEAARNVVFGYQPKANGAGFHLERFDFLSSNVGGELAGIDGLGGKTSSDLKTFFRPSDVSVGPDGAIYVADWFDPRVGGHSDQDKTVSGTIYRIAPKGFKPKVPEFDLGTTAGQISALKSPAVNVRALGFKALRDQGESAVKAVKALLKDENPFVRGRAIWLLAQLGDEGVSQVEALLKHEDANFRSTAYQALRRVSADIVPYAKQLAEDTSAAVLREVAVSMRDVPFDASKEVLLSLARGYDGSDRMFLEAWGIGCMGKEAEVFALVQRELGGPDPMEWTAAFERLAWRLTPPEMVEGFSVRAASESLSYQERLDALTAIAFCSTQSAVDTLFDLSKSSGIVGETARWWLLNYRNSRYAAFETSERLRSEGIYDPSKIVVSGSVIPEPNKTRYLSVAAVLELSGDAEAGAAKAGACYVCHKVGDQGVDYGPDLNGWASRQSTEVTVRAIVDPSSDIAHGYGGREAVLKNGTIVHGMIESESDPMLIRSMGGIVQMIPQERIERVNWYSRSLMLSADQLGLSEQDVADIVAYLKTL